MTTPTVDDLERLRRPLTGYCYRMLGAAADTDDAVQETIIRASAHLHRFDPSRAALSTWVHRIATNICLDQLRAAKRRAVAVDLGPASPFGAALGDPLPAAGWVEPMPDVRTVTASDPATIVAERSSLRLAMIAALQALPPRQRAVLILRDVLAFSAKETAEVLDTSVASVNSALQRARATLAADPPDEGQLVDPTDAAQQQLLDAYVRAFESHDVAGLTDLLRDDARASMPPFAWWVRGGAGIAELMGSSDTCAGARLLPTMINGCAGFGQYRPAGDGRIVPFALVLLETERAPDGVRISHVVTFLGTEHRFGEFGLPDEFG
ncbi:RNA polymerase subunit sigma-70 [Propionibacteriaceae bacterium Y2011]|uniref:RNA polymerase subunit sigma-70 n=1 Tax=Microlunatus sp. Y2014 TaxID=3418488 RepID=UPI003B4AD483